jgi:hypothetical protein
MGRISAEIVQLMRIVLEIEELLAVRFGIEHEFPAFIADHALRVGEHAGDEIMNAVGLMPQQWREALFQSRWAESWCR